MYGYKRVRLLSQTKLEHGRSITSEFYCYSGKQCSTAHLEVSLLEPVFLPLALFNVCAMLFYS